MTKLEINRLNICYNINIPTCLAHKLSQTCATVIPSFPAEDRRPHNGSDSQIMIGLKSLWPPRLQDLITGRHIPMLP